MTIRELGGVVLVVGLISGAGFLQTRKARGLEVELLETRAALAAQAEELETLRQSRESQPGRAGVAPVASGSAPSAGSDASEVMRLRSQVARLTQKLAELSRGANAASAATSTPGAGTPAVDGTNGAGLLDAVVGARITQLRDRLSQNPTQMIPEIAMATEEDWKDVVKNGTWDSQEEMLEAFKALRTRSKTRFATAFGPAMRRYAANNGGNLPGDLSQTAPYFDPPIDPAILSRYTMLQSGPLQNVPPNQYLIQENTVADPQHDAQFSIGLSGYLQGAIRGIPRR